MPMNHDLTVHDSCGNVFADLGMADADGRLAKAELSRAVRQAIRSRGLRMPEAAGLLGTSGSVVSDVLRGRLGHIPHRQLEQFLRALSGD